MYRTLLNFMLIVEIYLVRSNERNGIYWLIHRAETRAHRQLTRKLVNSHLRIQSERTSLKTTSVPWLGGIERLSPFGNLNRCRKRDETNFTDSTNWLDRRFERSDSNLPGHIYYLYQANFLKPVGELLVGSKFHFYSPTVDINIWERNRVKVVPMLRNVW